MSYLKDAEGITSDVLTRIRKRDFSGNAGLAVKNSIYQIGTTIVAKGGGLLFTVILARLLLPELFGLYSLALSTILIFATISELGISTAVIKFVSQELAKKRGKANNYLIYLGKIKLTLTLISAFLIIVLAKFLSESVYNKPIYLALLAGALYICAIQAASFLEAIMQSTNSFKSVFWKEVVFQIARSILVPLGVILSASYFLRTDYKVMSVILFLAISFLLAASFLFFSTRKVYFKKIANNSGNLSTKQKSTINKFIFATAILAISGTFFTNIDRIMLGKFVGAEFIGYYTAAASIIGALTPVLGFASVVLLPIFSRLKGGRLEQGLRKSIMITSILSVIALIIVISFSYYAILIAFGRDYLQASGVLRLLSVLLLMLPISAIFQSYYISIGKPHIVIKHLIIATGVNILLNYLFISALVSHGAIVAVYGAALATFLSQTIYLVSLITSKRRL